MPKMSVLTRDEAHSRAELLDVQHYTVELDLTGGEETFTSRTTIRFTVTVPDGHDGHDGCGTADTFADIKPERLHTATLDGRPLDPGTLDGNRLPLTGLTPGPHQLTTEATMRYSRTGEGMHRFTDPTDGETYTYTQLFLDDVQRVFCAFDQPDLKAVFELTVTAPDGWRVLANSVTEPQGDGSWRAAPTPLISTYLVAVAAGPWHTVRTEHRGLPFGLHCRRSLAPHLEADAEELLALTTACFDRYHEKFDEPYPFDSYDQAFVPEFNAGAMENPGLVTFRDEFVYRSAVTDTERQTRAMVIAHEMAHMWFGDLVTLKWWDDIWLNESFAEYMGYQTLTEATPFRDTWVDFGVVRKAWGYDADQRPSTHPVAPDAVDDTAAALLNFDGISYAKGASALRQLVHWLGEENFLAGINTHIRRHRFGNATLADFIDSLAQHSDRDLHAWAAAWLRTTGVDTLTPAVTADQGTWTLGIQHTGLRPHRLTIGLYDRELADTGRLVLRDRLDHHLPADGAPTTVTGQGRRPDLVLLNDQDHSYAKIRLDPHSWETALTSLSALPDPLARAVLWNAARDMVRDGELAPTTYLDAARAQLPYESDLSIVQGVLNFAALQIADRHLAGTGRTAALTTITDLCRDLIRRTEDGDHPGLRLTAVRHLVNAATQPHTISAWLADDSVPGGPDLDPELRWRILTRLAVLGAVDETAIDTELARDPSATGQEGAARCLAALPDPASKHRAWDRLFTDDTLSTYLFTATAQGFWQPEQAEILDEFIPRYFTDAVALAARRSPAIAEAAGRHAYPAHAVDHRTRELTETCLRTASPTPALRRKLTDNLSDLTRTLRTRG
ncbi:aminopeptidase N [Streptomyces sp. NPDC058045]|uniref:aminopeptidase N n=1 Tax=Streptomyces sp. NPDC058045 TaxID=3346311 RepID=UPI0036EB7CF6